MAGEWSSVARTVTPVRTVLYSPPRSRILPHCHGDSIQRDVVLWPRRKLDRVWKYAWKADEATVGPLARFLSILKIVPFSTTVRSIQLELMKTRRHVKVFFATVKRVSFHFLSWTWNWVHSFILLVIPTDPISYKKVKMS